jgi:hypothetical protein
MFGNIYANSETILCGNDTTLRASSSVLRAIGIMAYEIIVRSQRVETDSPADEIKSDLAEQRFDIRRHQAAANENELVWPLNPLFDGFFGA